MWHTVHCTVHMYCRFAYSSRYCKRRRRYLGGWHSTDSSSSSWKVIRNKRHKKHGTQHKFSSQRSERTPESQGQLPAVLVACVTQLVQEVEVSAEQVRQVAWQATHWLLELRKAVERHWHVVPESWATEVSQPVQEVGEVLQVLQFPEQATQFPDPFI